MKEMIMKTGPAAIPLFFLMWLVSASTALSAPDGGKGDLTLPPGIEKPDLPLSDKACFEKIEGRGVRLEVILYMDGSILGFEKKTLSLSEGTENHAVRYEGVDAIRRLLQYAASMGEKKKSGGGKLHTADVDLVVYASGDVLLDHLQRLMFIACEYRIGINRFHFGVKDKKTGDKGLIPYFLPLALGVVKSKGEGGKKAEPERYQVVLYAYPDKPVYALEKMTGERGKKEYYTFKDLGKALDALKEQKRKAHVVLVLGGVPLETGNQKKTVTLQTFVDLMTFVASRGVDLKAQPVVDVEPIEESESADKDGGEKK